MDEKARHGRAGRERTLSQNSSCYDPSGSCESVNILKVSPGGYQTNLYRYVIWSSASWDSSQTRTSIWPSCSRGLTRRNSFSNISWKCVAAITFGASSRLKRCSRIPQAKPMPSIPGQIYILVKNFQDVPCSLVPFPNSSINNRLRPVICFKSKDTCWRSLMKLLWILWTVRALGRQLTDKNGAPYLWNTILGIRLH